jgi:prevent-host-death family protein
MKIGSVADVKAKFSAYLKDAKGGPVVVTRNGKPVGFLISVEDDEELERLVIAYSPRFQGILKRARQHLQEAGGIPHEKFWKEMEPGNQLIRKIKRTRKETA